MRLGPCKMTQGIVIKNVIIGTLGNVEGDGRKFLGHFKGVIKLGHKHQQNHSDRVTLSA